MVFDLLLGRFTGNPDGVTKDEVSIKNISNRKIRSVMEAMLKPGSILLFDLKFIDFVKTDFWSPGFLQKVDEIDRRVFHLMNDLLNP